MSPPWGVGLPGPALPILFLAPDRKKTPETHPDHAQQLHDAGNYTVQRIADLLQVQRSTVYGYLNKTSIGRRPARKEVPIGFSAQSVPITTKTPIYQPSKALGVFVAESGWRA